MCDKYKCDDSFLLKEERKEKTWSQRNVDGTLNERLALINI